MVATDVETFVLAHTRTASPDLCPEVALHISDDMGQLWEQQEALIGTGLPPPFWCVTWVGGQALARYILDHPALVRNRTVLDLGSGSGICAIAAAKAGARSVDAYDVDVFSRSVLSMNARTNGVHINVLNEDVVAAPSGWDIILVGDLWYERFLAQRLNRWLQESARAGAIVLAGDCRRAYFPRHVAKECERYTIKTSPRIERGGETVTSVWRIQ